MLTSKLIPVLFCILACSIQGIGQEIEFDEPFDIRERFDIPGDFQVASSGSNVYVLWVFFNQDEPLYSLNLAYSNDGGNNFDVRVLYSSMYNIPPVSQPQMTVSDDTVHVAFFLGSSHSQIHYCHLPSDEDLPCRFPRIGSGLSQPNNLRMAAAGDNVYVAWNTSASEGNVYLAYSTDGGETFSRPINLTNDEDRQNRRQLTDLVATGNDVYLRWTLRNQSFLMHGSIVQSKFIPSH